MSAPVRSTRDGRAVRKIPRQADHVTSCRCLPFETSDTDCPPEGAGKAEVVVNGRQHKVAGYAGSLFVVMFAAGIVCRAIRPP